MLGIDLTLHDVLFHSFAAISTIFALLVILVPNPIYSSFFLALVMSVLGAMFFMLDAQFVAGAQITVYAGAVMVLFVMVMMLFDLKKDVDDVARFTPMTLIKILSCGVLCGIFVGLGFLMSKDGVGFIAMGSQDKAAAVILKNPYSAPTMDTSNPELLKEEVLEITQSKAAANDLFKDYTATQKLSLKLFSKFIFAFEILSVLLLVAIVGAVALAKSKGGTHHAKRPS